VLDTGVPDETVELARRIEAVGFGRLWVTEHHTETQSACPSIMAAAVLASTTRLSVTVGGVLARIHSPFFLAEQLKVLAKLYGDRVQFGVVGTLPSDSIRDAIGTPLADTPEEYRQRLLRLRDLALAVPAAKPAAQSISGNIRQTPEVHDGEQADQRHSIGPVCAEPTSFCICGTSEESATFTGELGFPFAFHHFLCPQDRQEDRIAVCQRFRESGGSRLSVAVSGISAASTSEAERLWEEFNRGRHTRRPSFLGSAEESAAQIATIVNEMAADEVVIQPLSNDFQTRISTLEAVFHPLKAHFDH
jgi:alkanesulfonate monooxygenase SsuD/methylene tetrahydromethanopterin reductase-like flavin-dependent oxidoreductase (luciferase family)